MEAIVERSDLSRIVEAAREDLKEMDGRYSSALERAVNICDSMANGVLIRIDMSK